MSSPNAAAAAAAHAVSLKVMRLSRPSFHSANLSLESSIATRSSTVPTHADDNVVDIGLSAVLSLPASFGNIYLGETFSSYLCINNESSTAVDDVSIKAELQTSTQRFTLADTLSAPRHAVSSLNAGSMNSVEDKGSAASSGKVSLLPTQSAEFLIHHEIKELGIHILVCSVHYITGAEKKFFRKFYKFQVLNPLAVKTKVNSLQDGRVFLEAQVQNVTGFPMFLERLKFEASELFEYVDMNKIFTSTHEADASNVTEQSRVLKSISPPAASASRAPAAKETNSVFGEMGYINPQDSRQYLYMLRPKIPHDPLARTTPSLGKLDILWRTLLGQTGRLQTSQLSRKVLAVEPFEITVLRLPESIFAEEPFLLNCRIRNNLATESLELSISGVKSKMSSVLLWGPSEIALGEIAPLGFNDFNLHLFPLLAGLHKVVGLRVTDIRSGASRDIDSIADVFIACRSQ